MLVSLDDIKTYLGIDLIDTTQDAYLTQQGELLSDVIESYCGRKFLSAEYIETMYAKDIDVWPRQLKLFHYPITAIAYVKVDDEEITEYRVQKEKGILIRDYNWAATETIEVRYTAGYASVPRQVEYVLLSLIKQNFNLKEAGIETSFGANVQRVNVAGVMSLDFDYTLESNKRANAYGAILGQYLNVLDLFRSERRVIGNGKLEFVEGV